ncbi:hypothetical protein PG997_006431 [Apiospora hydei]|uniref:Amidase domain-containing protein n=1 Tax=Apiospora hydei TaxID=1337664 RepID=A0ABR1WRH2_9PEZI
MSSTGDASWETLAAAKREAILASIPAKWRLDKIPTVDEQRNVTGAYIEQFLSPKGSRDHQSRLGGHSREDDICHQLVNCLHETFFDAALADAKELDAWFAKHGKPKGPLHGLPVSLKDQFHVKGVDTTMGYVGWIDSFQGQRGDPRSKTFESEMVRELRVLGAVLYCKTAVPHSLMCGETVNNIIGYAWNPANRHLSCGGSSGGEGRSSRSAGRRAASGRTLGVHPHPLGVQRALWAAADVGPAAVRGHGELHGRAELGAQRRRAAGLLCGRRQAPHQIDPRTWKAQTKDRIASSRLSIGFLDHDGGATPHPPLKRALALLRDVVARSGNKVFDWQPPAKSHEAVTDLIMKTWIYDGGADVRKDFALSGEPWAPQLLNVWKERPQADASAIAATNRALRERRKEYLDYWNGTSADVFVTVCAPFTVVRPGRFDYIAYTSFVNALDLPSVVVPVTTVDKGVDVVDAGFRPVSELDKKIQSDYDPEIYDGAPVSLQIVGRRYQEEKLLAIAEWLEGDLKKPTGTSHQPLPHRDRPKHPPGAVLPAERPLPAVGVLELGRRAHVARVDRVHRDAGAAPGPVRLGLGDHVEARLGHVGVHVLAVLGLVPGRPLEQALARRHVDDVAQGRPRARGAVARPHRVVHQRHQLADQDQRDERVDAVRRDDVLVGYVG